MSYELIAHTQKGLGVSQTLLCVSDPHPLLSRYGKV